jgi:hypothetical protein
VYEPVSLTVWFLYLTKIPLGNRAAVFSLGGITIFFGDYKSPRGIILSTATAEMQPGYAEIRVLKAMVPWYISVLKPLGAGDKKERP